MNQDVYDSLKVRARQALLAERMKTSAELQVGHMKKDGVPELALILMEDGIGLWRRASESFKRESKKICKGEPIYDFVEETVGLSTACFVLLGCLPPMTAFANPAKVWKYTGLFVTPDGRGPTGSDLSALKKENPDAGWSPVMRAHAIKRLAEPCTKMNGGEDKNGKPLPLSPYRFVYDRRKLRTRLTHPPMLEEGEGCAWCDACYEKRPSNGDRVCRRSQYSRSLTRSPLEGRSSACGCVAYHSQSDLARFVAGGEREGSRRRGPLYS